MTRLLQVCAWLCLGAIVVLSLVAPSQRPVTAASHSFEHIAIFWLAGLTLGLGYPNGATLQMFGLTLFSAAIEVAQLYAPGRHARVSDFVLDAFGACVGVGLALILTRLRAKS